MTLKGKPLRSLIVVLETCNYVSKCFFFDMNNLTFQGFPVGTKVDEQDPACVPNAKYTLGEFSVSRVLLVFFIKFPLFILYLAI